MQSQLYLLNNKPYKNTAYSRWYYYDAHERSLLKALPPEPFCPKKCVLLTVQRNYLVQLTEDHLYYSVPYQYVGKKVKEVNDFCLTNKSKILHKKRVLLKAIDRILISQR